MAITDSGVNASHTINGFHLLTQERWINLIKCKTSFLEDKSYSPLTCHEMNKEVTASWIRSREKGINPYMEVISPHLSAEEYKAVLNNNRLLIEITHPLVQVFKDMAILNSDFILYLCDKDGVFLLQEGEMLRRSTDGLVWREDTVGTCVHSLCMRLKRPVQLLGPEHYCVELHDIIATAAPIMGEGVAIATLILGQRLIERPWMDSFQHIRSHTLGLITSLATAVEGQLNLNKINRQLKKSYQDLTVVNDNLTMTREMLEATLSFIDEGIVTIDRTGKIIHINEEGRRILRLREGGIGFRNMKEFLGSQSRILSLVAKGRTTDIEESLFIDNEDQPCIINIRPVQNSDSGRVDVAVLRINYTEKIDAIVAHRSGSLARFNFEDIIGESKEFKRTIALAQRFAKSPENILLIGESGTGKELFAQAIHNASRPQGPFMAINCAAMPRELIESELFGYEGGSFTGAERGGRPGKLELAHGGTLFLDEIGDMPLELQAVLLRALEDKQVMRVGGRRYKRVDFRLVAATNRNIFQMVKENQFRGDLYFRLSVLTISILPLRKRSSEDVLLLSKYFVENYCKKQGWDILQISPAAQAHIMEYDWPGNVRQLQNAMIYAVNTFQGNFIEPDNLPGNILTDADSAKADTYVPSSEGMSKMLRMDSIEKEAIKRALLHTDNNVPAAAEILGISRSTLYRKLKDYHIAY